MVARVFLLSYLLMKEMLYFDPFMGSGTTYRVAERLGRVPVGIEINPEYIEQSKQIAL